ncbi:MAG TPA: hypothetical protein VMK42_12765 [Anaeromyxobacteraceae bacterium]|nr:hypothetical protein [Anaeromyxobacteraceae bacterium]
MTRSEESEREFLGTVRGTWAAAALVTVAFAVAPSVLAKECRRSQATVAAKPACADLPPGHPPVPCEGQPSAALVPGLPPGHPPVQAPPDLPAGHPPFGAAPELPPGHPPVNGAPRLPPNHPSIDGQPVGVPAFDLDAPQTT